MSFSFTKMGTRPLIPDTLEEAHAELLVLVQEPDLGLLKVKDSPDAINDLHFTVGQWIMENWKLFPEETDVGIRNFFTRKNVHNPMDIANIILVTFWRKINDLPLDLDTEISDVINYWNSVEDGDDR